MKTLPLDFVFLLMLFITSLCVFTKYRLMMLVVLLVLILVHMFLKSTTIKMHVVGKSHNTTLVVEGMINYQKYLFMIDTGYAGAPVLSSHYLQLSTNYPLLNVKESYAHIISTLKSNPPSDDELIGGINNFINDAQCHSFTSGCVMKLASIGETVEKHADMLMCSPLYFKTRFNSYTCPKQNNDNIYADIYVTGNLGNSVHILTTDYLLHSGNCLISISGKYIECGMSNVKYNMLKMSYYSIPAKLSGGAFVVPMIIQGKQLSLIADTGSSAPISVYKNTGLTGTSTGKSFKQSGVNGETLTSEVVRCDVVFCGFNFENIIISYNNVSNDSIDGYIGIGFLIAFDIMLNNEEISFKKNSNKVYDLEEYKDVLS